MGIMLILCQYGVPGVNLKGHSNSELYQCGISMFGIELCILNLKKNGGGGLCVSNTSQQYQHPSYIF